MLRQCKQLHRLCDQRVIKCCDVKYMAELDVEARKHHLLHPQADASHLQFKCYTVIKTNC